MKPDFSPIPLAKVHKKFQYTFIISKKLQRKWTFYRFFKKRGKKEAKYLQVSEIKTIFANRTMNVSSFTGLGCPRSEELSGSWRLFFISCLLRGIDFQTLQLAVFHVSWVTSPWYTAISSQGSNLSQLLIFPLTSIHYSSSCCFNSIYAWGLKPFCKCSWHLT